MLAIAVNDIGKKFLFHSNKWSRLFYYLFGWKFLKPNDVWALKDISFAVNRGEAVAIVGQNGAGKSTLLKIVTGTLAATEGSVQINGQISALLELGMGLNHELSGRENAIMVCQSFGFSNKLIEELIPQIKKFSELESYFEESLRVYSTGMVVRLAFSAATAVRPDILIVDEALSVGDIYFQHKSIARIRDFKEQGTTLFFVSHDGALVKAICNRAILLQNGKIILDDKPAKVIDYYNALIEKRETNFTIEQREVDHNDFPVTKSGTGAVRFSEIALLDVEGKAINQLKVKQAFKVKLLFYVVESVPRIVVGIMLRDRLGNVVFGTNTFHHGKTIYFPAIGQIITVEFSCIAHLGVDSYSLTAALSNSDMSVVESYEWVDNQAVFTVTNEDHCYFIGSSFLETEIEIYKNGKLTSLNTL